MRITSEIIEDVHAKVFANLQHCTDEVRKLEYDFQHDQLGKLDKEQYQSLIRGAKKQLNVWKYISEVTEVNNRYGDF